MKITLILMFLLSTFAWGIPEGQFPAAWTERALPAFNELEEGNLGHARYFYKVHTSNTKTLVILPGRTEPAMKYAELIYDLRFSPMNIFILDHRGQGSSPRILKDPEKGHVVWFSDYVNDLHKLVQVIRTKTNTPMYLVAHSMGGAIGVKYMAQYPKTFKKAVLSAPMLQINTAPYSETVGRILAKVLVKLGKGASYAPGWGPYQPELDVFETNLVTHSEERFAYYKDIFTRNPELVVWGPTARWVRESLVVTRRIDQLGTQITTPILLMQAGNDLIVRNPRQNAFCSKAQCTLIEFPTSKHEILMESDEIRNRALNLIQDFFEISLTLPKK